MAKQAVKTENGRDAVMAPGMPFTEEIGTAAGIVWRYLEQHGPVTLFQLKKDLDLSGTQVERAIGWLAREGKVGEENTGKKVLLTHKE